MDFAVQLEGEKIGRWVLSVDPIGDRLLVTNDDQGFQWVSITECRFIKANNPEAPQPVIIVQPNQKVALLSSRAG